jgi:hypothetical protein
VLVAAQSITVILARQSALQGTAESAALVGSMDCEHQLLGLQSVHPRAGREEHQ